MPSADAIKRLVGTRVTLRLAPEGARTPAISGRIVGALDAADGLVVTFEPASQPGKRLTIHYHHILEIKKEEG